ncbi:MAG: PDZ domain-containing protein [Polyangiales bacterium]
MSDHPHVSSAAGACAPYREALLPQAPPAPEAPRLYPRLSLALSAMALGLGAASMHVSAVLSGVAARPPMRHTRARPALTLFSAAEQLAARHRVPLYVAPDVEDVARRARVADATDGSLRDALRALNAYAAGRGLWLHDADGVLRLEREVSAAELACDGPVDVCATRLERLASITVQRVRERDARPVRLRLTRDQNALEAARAAFVAAGYAVDVAGRTLYLSTAAAPAREEGPRARVAPPGAFVLRRESLQGMLLPTGLARSVRIVPARRGGRVVGVRVVGVRPGDALSGLGVRSGDVILRVGGFDIATPDRCLEAYSRLRASDELRVEILRDGRRVTQTYVLV